MKGSFPAHAHQLNSNRPREEISFLSPLEPGKGGALQTLLKYKKKSLQGLPQLLQWEAWSFGSPPAEFVLPNNLDQMWSSSTHSTVGWQRIFRLRNEPLPVMANVKTWAQGEGAWVEAWVKAYSFRKMCTSFRVGQTNLYPLGSNGTP